MGDYKKKEKKEKSNVRGTITSDDGTREFVVTKMLKEFFSGSKEKDTQKKKKKKFVRDLDSGNYSDNSGE